MKKLFLLLPILLASPLQAQNSPSWIQYYPPASAGGITSPVTTPDPLDFNGVVNMTGTSANPFSVYNSTTHSGNNRVRIYHDATDGFVLTSAGKLILNNSSNSTSITSTGIDIAASTTICWGTTTACFARPGNGVIATGVTHQLQNTGGSKQLQSDYTNATATFSNTALSINIWNGTADKTALDLTLFFSDSTAADGYQIDFNGGTAAVSDFRVTCILYDLTTTIQAVTQTTALNGVHNKATLSGTGQHTLVCTGGMQVSTPGTIVVRAAQNTHSTGTLTIAKASHIIAPAMP